MRLFEKVVLYDSNEDRTLRTIPKWKSNLFLDPVERKRNGKYVTYRWEKLPSSVFEYQKKWNAKEQLDCWNQVKTQLQLLHHHKILHGDLHPGNVLRKKNHYYVIDFGLASDPKGLTLFERVGLQHNQDLFQFLWNLVFRSNQMIQDFSAFRKLFKQQNPEIQDAVQNLVYSFYSSKKIPKKFYQFFLSSKRTMKTWTEREKLCFQMYLERLYLCFYLQVVSPNITALECVQNFLKN